MTARTSTLALHHVELRSDPIRFVGSKKPDCPQYYFFDPSNLHLITITNSSNGITVSKTALTTRKVESEKLPLKFQKDQLVNAKYSLDEKFVAFQLSQTQIDFVNLADKSVSSLVCKKASANHIMGFFWTFVDNLFLITANGIELYQFPPSKKKEFKLIKDQKLQVNWYIYSAKHRVLLMSTGGPLGNTIQGYHFTANSILKIPKFTVDKDKSPLKQSELVITQIYGKLFCIHINPAKQEIVLYQLTREIVIKRSSINIHTAGQVAIQVVDNLLVVHNVDSKVAMIFDIKDLDTTFPVAAPLPIAPFFNDEKEELQLCIYNYTSEGYLWEIDLNLTAIALCFPDKKKLVDFLMKRSSTKLLLLQVLKNIIEECESLSILAEIFDMLNLVLSSTENVQTPPRIKKPSVTTTNNNSPSTASTTTDEWSAPPSQATVDLPKDESGSKSVEPEASRTSKGYLIIDQSDMYTHVFLPVEEEKGLDYKYIVAVLTEYIRSLNYHHRTVEPFLNELLINFLVRNNRFYQLHQLLQYHVVSDSVHVACQLLSLETTYPPAYQLALDMLKRLQTHEQIVEVLLTKNQIIPALRFMRIHKKVAIPPSRFLEAAAGTSDKMLYFTVYKFFEEKGEIPTEPKFAKLYKEYYSNPAIMEKA